MLLNLCRINDWRLNEALKAVFIALIILWALIGLDALGIDVSLVRGVVGVVYMLFVPGILILRVLRIHQRDSARTTLFAVGLSIATIMGTGLFMNVVYPVLGIEQPLTLVPVIATVSAATVILAAASYWRDRAFTGNATIDSKRLLSPWPLFLCLLPFIAISATYAMNMYGSNVGLLGLLVIIAATAFWICASDFFPKELYPLAVFTIALAMLYFASLISSNVWGWDIQKELYNANLVLANGMWNTSLQGSTNAVTSITLLAPILSLVSGVNVTWLFKIVYPLVFALVPLGLFVTFQAQTTDKIAFLGAFFVTSLFTFFGELPALARQEIAELFLVLLLILTIDKYRSAGEKRRVFALFAVFAASLVVSHYVLAIIFLAWVSIAWLLLFLLDNPAMSRLRRSVQDRQAEGRRMLTLVFVIAFSVFTVGWYLSLGSAASGTIDLTVNQILHTIAPRTIAMAVGAVAVVYLSALSFVYLVTTRRLRKTGTWPWLFAAAPFVLLTLFSGWGTYISSAWLNDILQVGTLSPLHEFGVALYLLSVLMIVVGLGALALRRARWRFDAEFIALAIASFAVLITALIVPQLAFSINATRLFHISTLVLAPFCVTGGLLVAQPVVGAIIKKRETARPALAVKLVAAFFVTFFLFSSGFVYEVTHQGSASFVLNPDFDAPVFNDREVAAAQWLHDTQGSAVLGGPLVPIYADAHRRALLDRFSLDNPGIDFPNTLSWTPRNAYIYLGTFNVERGQVAQIAPATLQGTGISYVDLRGLTDARSKIFDDGGATIYYRRTT